MPRIHCPSPLSAGVELRLPDGAARHVQVLRHQPGDELTLFNGEGGQWTARITAMGKSSVDVQVLAHEAVERELSRAVHLWVGLTANERMDWLIEKATELGVASITPVMAERSVLKLKGDRALKRLAHWQGIAQAACEQCGRNRVPPIHEAASLAELLQRPDALSRVPGVHKAVLSLAPQPQALADWSGLQDTAPVVCLSGPEGGLTPNEDALARAHGFAPIRLGARVLRAETAPLALLSALALWHP
ncbi:16S rRNA (uracil(1498)-N(3))-methyltransferase [Comamonas serinivorans]|uniref:Ribosomal RNA small subunit methyltransferase E n=1 Tax=Comamonas serinivorans TaxID=1082851 RepID=A0A1Y0EJ66_9BURK|nr:16S rRNA (uracil(1498)-N(3))-methyltransferase [Comamonas serinivorans]ARU03683.1 16S rRNA (uracil(1498)-N(3))-methyltransferase [Comamonas serinivorans]